MPSLGAPTGQGMGQRGCTAACLQRCLLTRTLSGDRRLASRTPRHPHHSRAILPQHHRVRGRGRMRHQRIHTGFPRDPRRMASCPPFPKALDIPPALDEWEGDKKLVASASLHRHRPHLFPQPSTGAASLAPALPQPPQSTAAASPEKEYRRRGVFHSPSTFWNGAVPPPLRQGRNRPNLARQALGWPVALFSPGKTIGVGGIVWLWDRSSTPGRWGAAQSEVRARRRCSPRAAGDKWRLPARTRTLPARTPRVWGSSIAAGADGKEGAG